LGAPSGEASKEVAWQKANGRSLKGQIHIQNQGSFNFDQARNVKRSDNKDRQT
jgi:hypothetical protein